MTKWVKGDSGNPGGRPKGLGEIREIARKHTDTAIETLVTVMNNPKTPSSARVGAATALLDRGWGRPVQAIEASINNPPALEVNPDSLVRATELLNLARDEPEITPQSGIGENGGRENEAVVAQA